jgi:hypothetical protein
MGFLPIGETFRSQFWARGDDWMAILGNWADQAISLTRSCKCAKTSALVKFKTLNIIPRPILGQIPWLTGF